MRVIAVALSLSLSAAFGLIATKAGAKPLDVKFTLSVHVAREDGKPVQDAVWIDAQIGRAEALFGPIGVHFVKENAVAVPDALTHLETRADRDALAKGLDRGRINVFITGSLRDVDTPVLMRQGVHWRPGNQASKHYVIIASTAGTTTLTHELGHFFGNGHSMTLNNVMSYLRFGDAVFFDEQQQRTITSFAGIFLRSKELTPR